VLPIACTWAQDPPANLAKLVAHRESESEAERNEYVYRQTVTIEELDDQAVLGATIARFATLSFLRSMSAPRKRSASRRTT
jgi:hypothetical protein